MVRYDQKKKAIDLRKSGHSYREILEQVPVAKSTLSLWLRSVHLSVSKKQVLTQKKLNAARRGAESRRRQRISSTEELKRIARDQVGALSVREKWLVGVALYWAEGSKQRSSSLSASVIFNNSDPLMMKFYKDWLLEVIRVDPLALKFEIYLHETHRHRLDEVRHYWAKILSEPINRLETVYFKKNIIKTSRKSTENGYYGLVRIRLRASSGLNRTISGWIEGIVQNCGVV